MLFPVRAKGSVKVCQMVTLFRRSSAFVFQPPELRNVGGSCSQKSCSSLTSMSWNKYKLLWFLHVVFVFPPSVSASPHATLKLPWSALTLMFWKCPFGSLFSHFSSLHMCVFLQKSHGNGPLNRLLMAAKRKYMDTELPPQESEGKVWHMFTSQSINLRPCQSESASVTSMREIFSGGLWSRLIFLLFLLSQTSSRI